jgi:hypothetical protein
VKIRRTRPWGGQTIINFPVLRHIEQCGPFGQIIQDVAGRSGVQLPSPGGLLHRKWPDRQACHQVGLFFAEQHLQDGKKQVRGRRSLREAVQSIGKPGIGRLVVHMRHFSRSRLNANLKACSEDVGCRCRLGSWRSARPGSGRIEELGSRRKGNRLVHKVVEIGLPKPTIGQDSIKATQVK